MAKRKVRKLRKDRVMILGGIVFLFFFVLIRGCMSLNKTTPVESVSIEGDPLYHNPYTFDYFSLVDGRLQYNEEGYSYETGIDVSVHQNEIDFKKVKADGISFVYIRAGYRGYSTGELHEDSMFQTNIKAAKKAGLKIGVYFFSQATTVDEAKEEAEFCLSLVEGYHLDLPIAYDMEYATNDDRIKGMSQYEMTSCAEAFAETIRKAGRESTIYGSASWLTNEFDMARLQDDNYFWVASYHTGKMPYDYGFNIWQYSSTGTVDGISTDVDLNIMITKK